MKNKKMKKKLMNNKGFSLLEVLLAIVILGLIAAPILQIFVTSAHINNNSRELMAATEVATMTMEHITSMKMDGGEGSARDYFTKSGSATRIPGVGYAATTADLGATYSGYTGFKGNTTAANDDSGAKKIYYAGSSDKSNLGLMMNQVTYNNFTFDVLVWCEATDTSGKFFTYDVTVEVYAIDSQQVENPTTGNMETQYIHYQERLVVMDGSIANE